MRVPTNVHNLHHGEAVTWAPPAGTAKFIVWTMTPIFSFQSPDEESLLRWYGGNAPGWQPAGGYDIAGDAALYADAGPARIDATADGVVVSWDSLSVLAAGFETETVQAISYDDAGRATRIDRYVLPRPTSIDAGTIAAQERSLLQTLLNARDRAAGSPVSSSDGEGISSEMVPLGVLDRRVAECRARIAWFEQAADGNILPRAEHW